MINIVGFLPNLISMQFMSYIYFIIASYFIRILFYFLTFHFEISYQKQTTQKYSSQNFNLMHRNPYMYKTICMKKYWLKIKLEQCSINVFILALKMEI